MGWCHEFGCQIARGCDHPMQAGETACSCSVCGTVCEGRFGGCGDVWARGPRQFENVPGAAEQAGAPPRADLVHPGRQPQPRADQTGAHETGMRVLAWMRDEFDGLRSQLQTLAGSVAQNQAVVREVSESRADDLDETLAQLETRAAELRGEAARLGGLEDSLTGKLPELVADAVRPHVRQAIDDRVPAMVDEVIQPELRAALNDVESCTAELREETLRLRTFREELSDRLPRLVGEAVEEALARAPAYPPAPEWSPVPEPEVGPEAVPSADDEADVAAEVAVETPVRPAPAVPGSPAPATAVVSPPTLPPVPEVAEPMPVPVAEPPLPVAFELPGLVAGPSLAAGICDALGQARLRRRRRRRASHPAPGLRRRDPFAGHLARRLERFARADGGPRSAKAVAGRHAGRADSGHPATVAAADRDGRELLLDLDRWSGLVLSGPGAGDAARAIVLTFVAQNGPQAGGAIVVGDLLPDVAPIPGLTQAPGIGPVLDQLEEEVTTRARLVAEGRADAALPAVLVAADDVPATDLLRLRRLLADGTALGITVVLVAATPSEPGGGGPAVRLGPGGLVLDAAPAELGHRLQDARMFTVGHEQAADLLAVLAAARTDDDHLRPGPDDDDRFRTEAPTVPTPISVSLLGTYRIEAGGEEVRSGLRAKARELLAFYLLHPEGTTLDEATEALWPDADRGRGPEWFWTALGNLRSRLRAVTGQRQLKVIERDGDIYRIEPLFDVDLWRLQQALTDAAASDDDAARTVAFDRAAQEYGGELLAGADWLWAETPRDDLRQRTVDALVWLGDMRWASGDTRGSWQALQRALEVDPLAEQVYRRIMRLQAKLSRPDDADATFRRLQARLEEVGLEPSPESEKLRVDLCGSA